MTKQSGDSDEQSWSNGTWKFPKLVGLAWAAVGNDGQTAAYKFSVMFAISILTQAAACASVLLVIKSLTVQEFGIVSSAFAAQSFGTILSTLGIRPILIRELSRHPERRDELCSAYILIAICGSTAVSAACLLVLANLNLEPGETFVFQIVTASIVLAAMNPAPVYDTDGRQVASVGSVCFVEVIALITIASLWKTNSLGVIPVATVFVAKWFAISLLGWGYLFWSGRGFRWKLNRLEIIPLLRSSTPLSVAAMLQTATISSAPLLARVLGGQTAAGIYGLAHQAVTAHMMIMGLASRIVAPRVSIRFEDSHFVIRAALIYIGMSCCTSIAGIIFGLFAMRMLLPPSFQDASWPLIALMVASAIQSAGVYSNMIHIANSRERVVLGIAAITTLAYLATALIVNGISTFSTDLPRVLVSAITAALTIGTIASLAEHIRRARIERNLSP